MPAAARKATPRKKPAASKLKGAHGGKRPGAGRPREKLPEELLKKIGAPPEDPLRKAEWWGHLLEVVQLGVLRGLPWTTMLRDVRANAAIAAKLVPEEVKEKALRLLEQDEQDRKDESTTVIETPREADRVAQSSRAVRRDPPRGGS